MGLFSRLFGSSPNTANSGNTGTGTFIPPSSPSQDSTPPAQAPSAPSGPPGLRSLSGSEASVVQDALSHMTEYPQGDDTKVRLALQMPKFPWTCPLRDLSADNLAPVFDEVRSIQSIDASGQYAMHESQELGIPFPVTSDEEMQNLKNHLAALAGDVDEITNLLSGYLVGVPMAKSPAKMRMLLEFIADAATKGNRPAQMKLCAPMYEEYLGEERYQRHVSQYYQAIAQEAEAGDPTSQFALSLNCKLSWADKARWAYKAGTSGNADAIAQLMSCLSVLRFQYDTPRLGDSDAFLLPIGANGTGIAAAHTQYRLGEAFIEGTYGCPQDATQAAHWLRSAHENGDTSAKYTLEVLLKYGFPKPKTSAPPMTEDELMSLIDQAEVIEREKQDGKKDFLRLDA